MLGCTVLGLRRAEVVISYGDVIATIPNGVLREDPADAPSVCPLKALLLCREYARSEPGALAVKDPHREILHLESIAPAHLGAA